MSDITASKIPLPPSYLVSLQSLPDSPYPWCPLSMALACSGQTVPPFPVTWPRPPAQALSHPPLWTACQGSCPSSPASSQGNPSAYPEGQPGTKQELSEGSEASAADADSVRSFNQNLQTLPQPFPTKIFLRTMRNLI